MDRAQLRSSLAAPRPAQCFTSRNVVVAGLRLHVRERGEAGPDRPWVLLHGLAVSHRYLMPTAQALPGRVFVPDLPGFGLSQRPRRVYDTGEHAAVVIAWMDAHGLSAAYLVGNSFGAQVAVEVAVRRPDLAAALWRWARDLIREDPRQVRIIARDIRDAGVRRIVRTLRLSVRHRMSQRLALVGAPILVLRGEHDPIASPDWVRRAAGLARDGQTGTVPGAAHNAVTTAGRFVAAQATAFVASPAVAIPRDAGPMS
jgi:pimeloyl-ACP methyl ester carboxylesterase